METDYFLTIGIPVSSLPLVGYGFVNCLSLAERSGFRTISHYSFAAVSTHQ